MATKINVAKRLKAKKNYGNRSMKVGFLANATYPAGEKVAETSEKVAEIAAIQEFGDSNIPSRPFFRTAEKKNKRKWLDTLSRSLAKGTATNKSLGLVGEMAIADIKMAIIDWNEPPNAPSTIKRKGFNHPLIHTKVMLGSVDKEIED